MVMLPTCATAQPQIAQPQAASQAVQGQSSLARIPYTKTLRLGYMRANQPFSRLPKEYFECSLLSFDPPDFFYGFPFHVVENDDDLSLTTAKLSAIQEKLPYKDLRDKTKYAPVGAIVQYLRESIECESMRYIGTSMVDSEDDIFLLFFFHASYLASEPCHSEWMDEVAEIAIDLLKEIGWEDVGKPGWYLSVHTRGMDDSTDYNIFTGHGRR